jgi:sugar O-acyltransferase (sialic acid O-acetyltransferase NeuD family)
MAEATPITIPLLNPNEPEALLAGVHVKEGQKVKAGDVLCTLETTKSASDVVAEADGYVVGLQHKQGESVTAGEIFAYLAESAKWKPPKKETAAKAKKGADLPEGLRITEPALALAQSQKIDLGKLPVGPLVTEETVRAMASVSAAPGDLGAPEAPFDAGAIIVYGGSGHGKACIDLLRALGGYRIVGVVDDGMKKGSSVMGVPVLGGAEALKKLHGEGIRLAVNAVGGIGNIMSRVAVFERLAQAGFHCPAVIHPTAFVEASAQLAAGAQVFPHAYVGSEAKVGYGAIVNTSAVVSHDCTLGDYANVAPGSVLAGNVTVGAATLIGMGVTINLEVTIGAKARIGNGATIKVDVPEGGLVQAGTIWPK